MQQTIQAIFQSVIGALVVALVLGVAKLFQNDLVRAEQIATIKQGLIDETARNDRQDTRLNSAHEMLARIDANVQEILRRHGGG